jgi:Molybdopterin-guanine dinucleotide biosynthesis protein A
MSAPQALERASRPERAQGLVGAPLIGAILAGGASSRMGGPKAFVALGDRALVEMVAEALSAVSSRVLLVLSASASEGEEGFAGLGLEIVRDEFPGAGPLAGIHAALAAAGGTPVLACGCDQPFLEPELLGWMAEAFAACGREALMARIGGRLQPLPAIYGPSCLGAARGQLEAGALRLRDFAQRVDLFEAAEEDCAALDPGLGSFMSINTPEELRLARRSRLEG